MKVTGVTIENYRSIREEVELSLVPVAGKGCFVLLGVNESGKSSILNAVALLDDSVPHDYSKDCNEKGEENGESIEITYELEMANPSFYIKALLELGLEKTLVDQIEFIQVSRKITIDPGERTDYFYLYIKESKTFEKYVKDGDGIALRTPENEKKDAAGKITNLLTKGGLESVLEEILFDKLEANTPEVIFWRLEPRYLINDKVDLNTFKENLNSSVPLKNCFQIAGIPTDKIKTRIEATVGSPSKTARLEELLGEKVTEHINEVWGEHKVNIKFDIDAMQLSFLVEDKDNHLPKYEVEKRSDGFKHFISILLNLSVENKTSTLKNKIILLDEPEIHLHPSGQRYLRDELLEISKNNVVIFATHSIFMVDTKNIDRHYSIKKEKGMTKAVAIERNDPYKEEVLFEALGTSALEVVEPNVILFEGKTDRDIFDLYARKFKRELKPPKATLISADGCESIIKYTKFFNTKIVKGYVLVDSDDVGQREKMKILAETGYNTKNTFEINDLLKTGKKSSLEDLFDKKYLIQVIKDKYALEIDLDEKEPLMDQVKVKLQAVNKPLRDEHKEEVKHLFFDVISKLSKDILAVQPYYKLAEKLFIKIA